MASSSPLSSNPAYPAAAVARSRAMPDPNAAARIFDAAVMGQADPTPPATVPPITREALLAFHAGHIVLRSATLYLVGDVTPEAARVIVERHFGG